MVRLILLIVGLVLLALMALNVALEINLIGRHPFEWLAGGLFFCWASTLALARCSKESPVTKFRDLLERTASTYVITLIGLLMAGGVFDATGTVHLDLAQKLLIAALPAAIAIPVNAIRLWLAQPPKSTAGDVLLRTVLTFGETFGGLLLASNVFDVGATGQMKTVAALGVASIPAALSFVKSWLASKVGTDSGSLDPTVGLGDTQPAPWINEGNANPF